MKYALSILLMLLATIGWSQSLLFQPTSNPQADVLIDNDHLTAVKVYRQDADQDSPILQWTRSIDRANYQIRVDFVDNKDMLYSIKQYDKLWLLLETTRYDDVDIPRPYEKRTYLDDGTIQTWYEWDYGKANEQPQIEKYIRYDMTSRYDENQRLISQQMTGNNFGEIMDFDTNITYGLDEQGRVITKLTYHKNHDTNQYQLVNTQTYIYKDGREIRTTEIHETGETHIERRWYNKDGLVEKTTWTTPEERKETLYTYKNGMLTMRHETGHNARGKFDTRWTYEYE